MKRRKQIGKLIYDPQYMQADVKFSEDYESLPREEKLDVLAEWISDLLEIRNEMIPNPKSWHHFMNDKIWHGLTDKEVSTLAVSAGIISWSKHDFLPEKKQFRELPIDEGMDGDKACLMQFARLIEAKLREKNI